MAIEMMSYISITHDVVHSSTYLALYVSLGGSNGCQICCMHLLLLLPPPMRATARAKLQSFLVFLPTRSLGDCFAQ